MPTTRREVPAQLYDAILARADELGGIGRGVLYDRAPICLYGIAIDVGYYGPEAQQALTRERTLDDSEYWELYKLILDQPIAETSLREVDEVVRELRWPAISGRVSAQLVLDRLGFVRVEAPDA